MLTKLSSGLVLLAAMSILAACQTTTSTGATDVACLAFEPIEWSGHDTWETIIAIRQHNAAWDELCDPTKV